MDWQMNWGWLSNNRAQADFNAPLKILVGCCCSAGALKRLSAIR
jgi:hypothetical protein